MILNFKVDTCERLWLTFCSAIRVSDISHANRKCLVSEK